MMFPNYLRQGRKALYRRILDLCPLASVHNSHSQIWNANYFVHEQFHLVLNLWLKIFDHRGRCQKNSVHSLNRPSFALQFI